MCWTYRKQLLTSELLNAGPYEPQNYLWLADVYQKQGQTQKAKALLKRLLAMEVPEQSRMLWSMVRLEARDMLQKLDDFEAVKTE
jgi:hypothetical protein